MSAFDRLIAEVESSRKGRGRPTLPNTVYDSTPTSEYRVLEPGIIEQRIRAGAVQTVDSARRDIEVFVRMAGPDGATCLVDLREGGGSEPGVNDVYASPELSRHALALALLTGSTVSQMVGNLFLALKRPSMPTRMFGSRQEALMWLRQHIPKGRRAR